MTEIWVVVIASIVAPTFMKLLEWAFSGRHKQIKDMNMRMRRLEIQMNISHNPEDAETILDLYDEYRKEGGNSYIQTRVEQWKKECKYGNY